MMMTRILEWKELEKCQSLKKSLWTPSLLRKSFYLLQKYGYISMPAQSI